MESCFSVISLYGSYLRRNFTGAGLRFQSISIDNGETTLSCWISKERGDRPTVVLIHGFGPEPIWQWADQVRSFSRHFRLIVPELVFFGSSITDSAFRTEVFQADCLVKLLDHIGVDRFSVVGTSYGGFVAYHMARMCGEGRVERVVVASSDLLMRERDNTQLIERAGVKRIEDLLLPVTPAMARKLVTLGVHRPPGWIPEFVLRDFIRTLYSANREEKVQLIKGITLDTSDGLEQLSQEVLIVWGEHDNIFPLEKARSIKKQVGENVVLEVMNNTGHLPQMEDPKRFNAIVKNFLLGNAKVQT